MMKLRKVLALLIIYLLSLSINGFAQSVIPSPNVASLAERAIVPVNTFSGQADIQVPIYEMLYNGVRVPISIAYNTRGHKVKDAVGFLGIGWNLNAGGSIFRKKNGPTVDEHHSDNEPESIYSYYQNMSKVSLNYNNYDFVKKYAFDGAGANASPYYFDGTPDAFVFNFNGYSGEFYLTSDSLKSGIDLVFRTNGDYSLKGEIMEIKNDLTFYENTGTSSPRSVKRAIYAIKITDDKGYQYIFGNSVNNIEFGNPANFSNSSFTTANAWHLSEIITPSGQKIEFVYERKGKLVIPDTYMLSLLKSSSYNFKSYAHILLAFDFTSGSGNSYATFRGTQSSYYFSFPTYLKSIKTPLQEVNFHYSPSNARYYNINSYAYPTLQKALEGSEYWGPTESSPWKLDSVTFGNRMQANFSYIENTNRRLCLEKVEFGSKQQNTLLKEQEYKFKYNPLLLPSFESQQTDHWGFYNGNNRAYTSDYYQMREANFEYAQAEALQLMIYPNKGTLALIYEPHEYDQTATQFPFSLKKSNNNLLAGGLRIKKLIYMDTVGDRTMEKEYFYIKDYVTGGRQSSGVLSGSPKYSNSGSRYTSYKGGNFWSGGSGSTSMHYQKAMDRNMFPMSNTNGNHVTYTEVTEKTNGGYTTTTYTNHDNGFQDKAPLWMHWDFDSESIEDPFISMQAYRGLVLSTKAYNGDKQLQREIINSYQVDTVLQSGIPFLQRVIVGEIGGIRASSGKYPSERALISKIEEIDYHLEGNSTKEARFLYYGREYSGRKYHGLLRNKIVKDSKGNESSTTYRYPFSFYTPIYEQTLFDKMLVKNIISIPVEQYITKDTDILGVNVSMFADFNGKVYPSSFSSLRTKIPFSSYQKVFVNTSNVVVQDSKLNTDSRIIDYDSYGNPTTIQDKNGVLTTYLYGYGGEYLLAKVTNASYENIRTILGSQTINNLNLTTVTAKATDSIVNILRKHPNLKDASIVSYTYTPLIGVSSKTDARGVTESYDYDIFNRLAAIRDQKNNILQSYSYERRKELVNPQLFTNKSISKAFQRNSCPVRYKGTTQTYSVPTGTYISIISQADADQQAQADIDANGQIYVNEHAPCVPAYTTIRLFNSSNQYLGSSGAGISLWQGNTKVANLYFPNQMNTVATFPDIPTGVYRIETNATGGYQNLIFRIPVLGISRTGSSSFDNIDISTQDFGIICE